MFKIQKTNNYGNVQNITKEQLYSLDCNGIIILKNFLNKDLVDFINVKISDCIYKIDPIPCKFSFFEIDPIFVDIMSNPWIVSACKEIVGENFRMDHVVGIEQPGMIKSSKTNQWVDQGYLHGNIHGGLHSSQGSCFYESSSKKIWAGHMTFGISLTGQSQKTGGFCYIPGSHKQSNDGNGADIFKEIMNSNFSSSCIQIPEMNPGDAVFFPESLMHGSTPLIPPAKRRSIYYKYLPGFCVWRSYQEIKHYINFAKNDIQKKMLREPFVASIKEENFVMSDNFYKESTV